MKQLWNQLRPGERRWVAAIGCVVFIVLNYFLVWPKFKEWRVDSKRMNDAAAAISNYQKEIAKEPSYRKELAKFETDDSQVASADQILNFSTFYQGRAVENGVQIQSDSPRPPRTNDFSVDLQTTLEVVGSEKGVVGFLYSLGSSASQMRVREMSLHAVEPNRYQLHASLTIVASYSYQKKPGAAAKPAAKPVYEPPRMAPPPANYLTTNTLYPTNRPRAGRAGLTNALSPTNKPGQRTR